MVSSAKMAEPTKLRYHLEADSCETREP